LTRFDRLRRRWDWCPFVRTIFPEPVRRKRFAVPLWVFNLYLVFFLRFFLLIGSTSYASMVSTSFRQQKQAMGCSDLGAGNLSGELAAGSRQTLFQKPCQTLCGEAHFLRYSYLGMAAFDCHRLD
jgi:hypothetical protein